jgi:transcriptional regulator with PAS, ATPase and Fis domain
MVDQGRFRKDLYYRLHVVVIDLPPLRERQGDISLLAHHFLHQYGAANKKSITAISQAVLKKLEAYTWPGNVRELENTIERATLFETGPKLTLNSLPRALIRPDTRAGTGANDFPSLEQLSKHHICKVLEKTNHNKTRASRLLGIDRSTLWRIMNRLDIK